MFTSCTLPSVMWMNVGMLPCRSSSVCILTAALCLRNLAHGNSDRQRSMVVESQCVHTLIDFDADRIGGIERSCDADQDLGELGIDAPVARLVRVGQCRARYLAVEAHVVKLRAHRAEARFYVAQALPIS